jgi:hypothetical protein
MCLKVWLVLGYQVHQRRHFGGHLDDSSSEERLEWAVSGVADGKEEIEILWAEADMSE